MAANNRDERVGPIYCARLALAAQMTVRRRHVAMLYHCLTPSAWIRKVTGMAKP